MSPRNRNPIANERSRPGLELGNEIRWLAPRNEWFWVRLLRGGRIESPLRNQASAGILTNEDRSGLLGQHLQGLFFQDGAVQGAGPFVEDLAVHVDEERSRHAQNLVVPDHVWV